MSVEPLVIWTIYDHPSDYPNGYVTRLFEIRPGSDPIPTGDCVRAPDIELLRRWIQHIAPGSVCLTRQPEDDPVIVESWL